MKSLSDEEIESIAEKAAEKAARKVIDDFTNQVYVEVGRAVLHKVAWAVGVCVVGFALWAVSNGWVK